MKKLETILDWIRYTSTQLSISEDQGEVIFAHGNINAIGEAHSLILGLLSLPYDLESSYFAAKLTTDEIKVIKQAIEERIIDKKPVPYITNKTLFMGLEFYVDERVLIPRSPIAELIKSAYQPYLPLEKEVNDILDLCTGSGCIAIANSYIFPDANIVASDIDESCLEVADINVIRHDILNVEVVASDMFENLKGRKFDIIVSNPPYVDKQTVEELPAEFEHEPVTALLSGEDGLDAVKIILKEAINYLNEDGVLVVEVGDFSDVLEAKFPEFEFNWHNFKQGGQGVFIMTYDELHSFNNN